MEGKKESAVEWLELIIKHCEKYNKNIEQKDIDMAKKMERNQHGDTWDAAIQAHEDRGHVLARSICDFDNYFNETYENKN
jgi:hypothetical protein